jgi:hypothetical protein
VIDIVRGDLLVEIQTGNFSAIRRKLRKLTLHHRVRLVYPVARDRWIVRLSDDGRSELGRRRSPKTGTVEHIFEELIRFPELLLNANFSIELLLIQEEEIRRHDAVKGWRKKGWVTCEHRLLGVLERHLFRGPSDVASLIPSSLSEPFSTLDLAHCISRPRHLAQKMVYCLRRAGCITQTGKAGRSILYARSPMKESR